MRIGLLLPQHDTSGEELLDAARLSEEAGLDSVWISDHLHGRPASERPILEGWSCLAAVAAVTTRVKVGALVMRVTLRAPRLLAAMARTMENVAPGRVVVGLGLGDSTVVDEQRAHGIAYPGLDERVAVARSTIEELSRHAPGVGIVVGGGSPAAMRIAAEVGSWNWWGPISEFPDRLDAFRNVGSGEVSWGGSMPAEGPGVLADLGADEVIVAAGAGNYRQRIEQLAGMI